MCFSLQCCGVSVVLQNKDPYEHGIYYNYLMSQQNSTLSQVISNKYREIEWDKSLGWPMTQKVVTRWCQLLFISYIMITMHIC